MQNGNKIKNKKASALQQLGVARGNLLLMIILTAINIILFSVGTDTMLLFSATVPYYITVFGFATEIGLLAGISIAAATIMLGGYLLCWFLSKKHYGWMIAALVFFIIDSIIMVLLYVWAEDFSGILDVLIHIWVLYYLIVGVKYGYQLKHLTPEEESEYEALEQHTEEDNVIRTESTPLRVADTDIKHRILIEGDFIGHHIAYRRVKTVNELVIDSHVYDELDVIVEKPHSLNAVFDGYKVSVGYDGVRSYISIDDEIVAKKVRLI